MLLQLRNVSSQNLNIQTVGRIKRNPYPKLEKNDITDIYYLYSNNPNETIANSIYYEYKVKEQFDNEEFASIVIKKDKELFDISKLESEVKNFLINKSKDIRVMVNQSFDNNCFNNKQKKIIIKSPILLLKLLKVMEESLTNYQKKVFSAIEQEYKNTDLKGLKYKTLKIILLSYFIKDINNIVQRCIENNIKYELVMGPLNPKKYEELKSDDIKNLKSIKENYLFNITKDGEITDNQPLDSTNELVVFDKIKAYIEFIPKGLKVWAKNQIKGNIFGEYLDENKYFKNSYFDFILKYNNGVLLYIEVKGENDIDVNKTELLRTAYSDYFKDKKLDLFQQKIVICLAKVNGELIIPEVFYDKSLLNLPEGITFTNLLKHLGEC